MRLLKGVLVAAASAFLLVQVLVYFFQEHPIFYPEFLAKDFEFRFHRPFEELWIPSGNAELNAVRFRVKDPRGIIVYYHGNAGSLREWGEVGADLSDYGYDVLVYDYRGFGKTRGRYRNESEILSDARSVLSVARKDFPPEKIVIFGRSLGSGLATRMAAEIGPEKLVLETPFRSLLDRARSQFPFVLPFVIKYPLRSDLSAPKIRSPVLILHGTADEIVPYDQGRALSRDFPNPPKFVTFEGGHHGDLSNFPEYSAALRSFLIGESP